MAIQGSGLIKLSDLQAEFTGSNPISMSEYYRNGIYVTANNTSVPTSGSTSLSNYYNAVRQFAFSIASNQTTGQNLRALAVAAGWDQAAPVVASINSGVVISSNATSTAALTVDGSWPGGVTLNNAGTIVGMGGAGGRGGTTSGSAGGRAMTVSAAISINNAGGVVAGGGGGGGGGTAGGTGGNLGGGGGGGGGRTGLTNSARGEGGSGGSIGPGAAGAAGTFAAAGASGNASYPPYGGRGGAGGNWGVAGVKGVIGADALYQTSGNGGAAGAAVNGNSYITWTSNGTRTGALT